MALTPLTPRREVCQKLRAEAPSPHCTTDPSVIPLDRIRRDVCQKLRARRAETQADNAVSQQAAAVQAAVAAAMAAGAEGWPAFAG